MREKIRETIPKLRKTPLEEHSIPNGNPPAGIVHEDRITAFGKYAAVNPAVVERTLIDALGGIKDRTAFDNAVSTLPYEEIIARYTDPHYADQLFEWYSAYSIIPVADAPNSILHAYRSASPPLIPPIKIPETLSSAIDTFLSINPYARPVSERELIHTIITESAKISVDMTDLLRAYETKSLQDMQDFIANYQTFLDKKNDNFRNEYDQFFDVQDDVVKIRLDSRLEQFNIIKIHDWYTYPPDYLFAHYGLIHLGNGLYHFTRETDINELYEALAMQNNESVSALKKRVGYMAAQKNVPESGYMTQQKEELLVLYNLAYKHPNVPADIDIQQELSRYKTNEGTLENREILHTFPYAFYRFMLEEKANNTPLYQDILSHFKLSEKTELLDTDANSIKDIEDLFPEGRAFQMKQGLQIGGLFITNRQQQQHAVRVFRNGTPYLIYIHANPAVAQAVNLQNLVDAGPLFNTVSLLSRWMAVNFTTRNPLFVVRNFLRDRIYTATILPVKEGPRYTATYLSHLVPASPPVQTFVVVRKVYKAAMAYVSRTNCCSVFGSVFPNVIAAILADRKVTMDGMAFAM